MDLDRQIQLEHLLFQDRVCRVCGIEKNLLTDYYLTRKDRGDKPSAYSYECKSCTIKRIIETRKNGTSIPEWEYPDW